MVVHIEMNDASACMSQGEEDIQDPETQGRHHEEVDRRRLPPESRGAGKGVRARFSWGTASDRIGRGHATQFDLIIAAAYHRTKSAKEHESKTAAQKERIVDAVGLPVRYGENPGSQGNRT
jgi:hypothetical protein